MKKVRKHSGGRALESSEDCDRCGERYHGEFIAAYLRNEEKADGEVLRVCCPPIKNIKGYKA